MSWFKVDDKFPTSPKVMRIPRAVRLAAIGLWTTAGAWSAEHEQDGKVPAFMVDEWCPDGTLAGHLVTVGLWDENEDGYAFHDWSDYQPTRAENSARREAERTRKEEWRRKKAEKSGQSPVPVPPGQPAGQTTDSSGTDATVPSIPTRPDPTYMERENAHGDAAGDPLELVAPVTPQPDRFPEFWAIWPRKESKADAQRAWSKAIKTTDPDVILVAARVFAESPHRPERQFVPYGASWLNARRWEDPAPAAPEERRPSPAFDPDAHYAFLRSHGSDPSEWAELCGWHGEREARRILEARVAA